MSNIEEAPGFFAKMKKDPIPAIGELIFKRVQIFTSII